MAVGLFFFRHRLPAPVVVLRNWKRIRALRALAAANPADARARKELAKLLLEVRRPEEALRFAREARSRCAEDAELLVLEGTAELRCGNAEAALAPLVALGRLEEAEDAYLRFLDFNGSSLEGYYRLARARRGLSQRAEARDSLREARETWLACEVSRLWT